MANNLSIDDVSVLANAVLSEAQGITDVFLNEPEVYL